MTTSTPDQSGPACCAPRRSDGEIDAPRSVLGHDVRQHGTTTERFIDLDGGSFLMGCNDSPYPTDGEAPARETTIGPFAIAATAVSNRSFASFVETTGYVTAAERFGWSFVFAGLLPDDFPPTRALAQAPWWRQVDGADWRHPEGPHSDVTGRGEHPVVHVTWNDADTYCRWAGAALPTEPQWEFAARGGLEQRPFPWGDELLPSGEHQMNVWQGSFPILDTGDDGYVGTAPVNAFSPNAYGLHNMTGNVWEWCHDRFSTDHRAHATRLDPAGPRPGEQRVLKGGSYLCHASYCLRYRTSARIANTPESSAGNIGFRCARRS